MINNNYELTGNVFIKDAFGIVYYRRHFESKVYMKGVIKALIKQHKEKLETGHFYLSVMFD